MCGSVRPRVSTEAENGDGRAPIFMVGSRFQLAKEGRKHVFPLCPSPVNYKTSTFRVQLIEQKLTSMLVVMVMMLMVMLMMVSMVVGTD